MPTHELTAVPHNNDEIIIQGTKQKCRILQEYKEKSDTNYSDSIINKKKGKHCSIDPDRKFEQTNRQAAAVSTTTKYAAAAVSRSTVYNLDNNKDNSHHSLSSSSDSDNSIVVVGKKPAARPEGKTPFPWVLGEVLLTELINIDNYI